MCTVFVLDDGFIHLFYPNGDIATLVHYTRLSWALTILSAVAISLGKVSIALLIVRIMDRTSRKRIWSLYITSSISLLNCVGGIIVLYKQCLNLDAVSNVDDLRQSMCWSPLSGKVKYGYTLYAASKMRRYENEPHHGKF